MDTVSICVAFLAAILGIAYPVLLEVVSRLDEKYSSQVVVDLFQREKEKKFFTTSLVASLIILLFFILKLPPPAAKYALGMDLSGTAAPLLLLATVIVVISFFFFIRIVFIYYRPVRFFRYLEKKHAAKPGLNDYEAFRAISDLLYYAIRKQNDTIAITIWEFMSRAFHLIGQQQSPGEVVFPKPYYDTAYNCIQQLASNTNKRLQVIEQGSAGGSWILNASGDHISEASYSWLWLYNLLAIEYDRNDFINLQWEQAYQYKSRDLNWITPDYNDDGPDLKVLNQEQIDIRNQRRRRFMEFYYALGGLLVAKGKYPCLKKAFNYTQSIPPRYELLPETMDEVFHWYFEFSETFTMERPFIEHRYPFPDLSGLHAGETIRGWIAEYMAILFLRQYTIIPHLYGMEPLALPQSPSKQYEKKNWIDQLPFFKRSVERLLQNQVLLKDLGMEGLTIKWCEENNVDYPLELVDKIIENMKDSFEQAKITQEISETKRENFLHSSKEIVKDFLGQYDQIRNPGAPGNDTVRRYIYGVNHVMNKSTFADDQESQSVDYDTFTARTFSDHVGGAISEIFISEASRRYNFELKDFPAAIARLGINNDEFILIAFGIGKSSILSGLKEAGLQDVQFIGFNQKKPQLGNSVFVVRKNDLPYFTYKDLKEQDQKLYDTTKIIDEYKIFATVADLYKATKITRALQERESNRNFEGMVFVAIYVWLEVQIRKGAQWIEFLQSSAYRQQAVPNKLQDVEPLVVPQESKKSGG